MLSIPWPIHRGLASAGRLPAFTKGRLTLAEIGVLLLCGVSAALLTAYAAVPLRIPGHAIIRSVFPMALGLALVPRYGAGLCMSGTALGTALLLQGTGLARMGAGATTSLVLTGPMIDLALLGARSGWRLYLGFVLGGVASNMLAMLIRGGVKGLWPASMEGRPFSEWFAQAAITYPLCGAVAGLISAVVWFRFRAKQERPEDQP